jgi:serine/threonine protein kinase
MHAQGAVHGNIKGVRVQTHAHPHRFPYSSGHKANILIDHSSRALLAGFALTSINLGQTSILSSCIEGGTVQWMSPELLHPDKFGLEKSRPTKESDCYMLGMLIYEVLSGLRPYAPYKGPVVIRKVLDGELPERPRGNEGKLFTDEIWRVVQLCWKAQPRDRISAEAILLVLEGNPVPSRPLFDMETENGNQSPTIAYNSSAFHLFHTRLIFDSYCIIIGLHIGRGDTDNRLVSQRTADPQGGRSTRTWEKFKTTAGKLFGH